MERLPLSNWAAEAVRKMLAVPDEQRLARPEVAWEAATVIQGLIEQLGRGGESVLVVLPGLESIPSFFQYGR